MAKAESNFEEWSEVITESTNKVLEDVGSPGEEVHLKVVVANDVGETESREETITLLTEGKIKISGLDHRTVSTVYPGTDMRIIKVKY